PRGPRPAWPHAGLRVPRRPKGGDAIPQPISVHGQFQRGHLCIDMQSTPRDGIEAVGAKCLIEGVANVQSPNVPIPRPPEVIGPDAVRYRRSIGHNNSADWRRTYQEAVLVVMDVGLIIVVVEAEFGRVAPCEEVLNVNVGDPNLLVPGFERIQPTVRVLFQ